MLGNRRLPFLFAAVAASTAIQGLAGLETLQGTASIVRGLSDTLSSVLPWPLQQPVAVLGSDVAGVIGFQPQLDGIERLAVRNGPLCACCMLQAGCG
jgi:hypothetical protein